MNPDFTRVLASLRQEKGISQRKAAQELGISQALLSLYEKGAREPGLAFVRAVCDYYDVSADYLLGRSLDRGNAAKEGKALSGAIQKTQLVDTTALLFDLLGKTGSKDAVNAAAGCLGGALYPLFRALNRAADGGRRQYMPDDLSDAVARVERARYARALDAMEKGAIPLIESLPQALCRTEEEGTKLLGDEQNRE